MNFFEYRASKVWFTQNEINVKLVDGREATLALVNFPLLLNASKIERENFKIINGYALYWENIGEDLSVAGFFEDGIA